MPIRGHKHWDQVYVSNAIEDVSWFENRPATSMRLVTRAVGTKTPDAVSIIDVGAGASLLVEDLLAAGIGSITLLDVSREVLDLVGRRLGPRAHHVVLVSSDLLRWEPERTYDIWHDRAVFHFLATTRQRRAYASLAARSVVAGGALVLGVFAEDGPTSCSGLPTTRHSPEQLASSFAPAFALEHGERELHSTPGGAVQAFSWVLLRRQ